MTGQGKRPREPTFRLEPGQAVEAMDMAEGGNLALTEAIEAIQELRADMIESGKREAEARLKFQKLMEEQHQQTELADLTRQADILALQTEASDNKARAAEQETKQAEKDVERDNVYREAMAQGQKEQTTLLMRMMSRMMMEVRAGAGPEEVDAGMEEELEAGAGGTKAAQGDPTRDKSGGADP